MPCGSGATRASPRLPRVIPSDWLSPKRERSIYSGGTVRDSHPVIMFSTPRHNASDAKELADLANHLQKAGSHSAYEQVMAAVSDFEKGTMRLSVVLSSLDVK